MLISAVVITKNEAKNIARCLKALDDPRIHEIVVSDSNSTDDTRHVVSEASKTDARIKFFSFSKPPFTAARGRNEGAAKTSSTSTYLLFLDGDMELASGFIDQAITELESSNELAAISGQMHNFYYNDTAQPTKKDFNFYVIQENKPGGALFFNRQHFQESGGFNSELIVNEEMELFYRLSKKHRYFKRIDHLMIVHHTELPGSRARVFERLADRRVSALAINAKLGFKDFDYMKTLIKENKYVFIFILCFLILLLSIALKITPTGLLALTLSYAYVAYKTKSMRIPMNYIVYAAGTSLKLIHDVIFLPILRRIIDVSSRKM